jgi:hypothetical protein
VSHDGLGGAKLPGGKLLGVGCKRRPRVGEKESMKVAVSTCTGLIGPRPAYGQPSSTTCGVLLGPETVRDDLREYVVGHLADEETGVLIVDEIRAS